MANQRIRIHSMALLLGALPAAAGCANDSPTMADDPGAAAQVVASAQIQFEPPEVEVRAGETVTWRFEGVPHNVFFLSGPQPPGDIPDPTQNTSVSRTFTTAGAYDYECRIHPGMTGRVIVAEESAWEIGPRY